MIDSRKIEDLLPQIADKARQFLSRCEQAGLQVLVISTYRDFEKQAALYALGRSSPGKIVTNAKPGTSAHNFRRALDLVPLKDGKPWWNAPEPLWQQIGKIGQDCGFEWGGAWTGFKDRPHFQCLDGKPLSYWRAQAGK